MDFNFKNKLWAGNIYHQFESICKDVDGFVNKDTVKFVGNQVQSVGLSVKRLYSDVVQDILPLSGDTAKPEQQLAAGEKVDMQDHVSITGTGATSTSADEMQLAKNQVSNDHKVRISKPADVTEAQTCQYLTEQGDVMVQNREESISAEMNVTKDLKPVTVNSSYDSEFFSGKSYEDISSSPAFSAHEEGSTSIEEEIRDFNQQKEDEGFSDDTMHLSDTSSTAWLSKSTLVEDPYLDVNGSLSSPPVPVSIHKVDQDNCPLMDSPLPPTCDVDDGAQEKYSALSKSCSTKDDSVDLSTSVQSSEHMFPYYFCNEKEEKIALMPSTSCTSLKSSITTESTSADLSKEAENILHSRSSNSSVSDCCTYNITAASSIKVDGDPAFLMMESNELHTDRSESVDGSFESEHEEHYKNGHSKIVMSPSETVGDLDLENVDLSSNVKHDGGSVILYSNFAAAGSYRRKNFRYYKKLIQGAFTSQKRLTKEYEHLAIMYGNIDVESNQHYKPSSLFSSPYTALHAERTQSSREMSENEWELL
ncbi:uncharacterized protein LOC130986909 isoform X2 [Salvia miltiorrhiza]|uniref:uncharacterized protein LOC130986909 isoform X2 n=1 Tax=Salvia miltiorrhiza TaxID=226208 RepID=UPI0025AD79B9|nr:uncharacterized protein LOC130986909 isoform X2 [Salvia miltiorrhiza]XP_057766440.1 uncharacterized protein LOC130986909 isoform X2 [Salvia miltiorrhiza]XP_057766441.1 uncharacterized protein LOC130986909 isoform X2 [Salvia miltiorrhiza]XP_057766442.1 uncharacterized protein LOC130986909 isoform X2 [Salvia miltiorrhiza]XP_057766443.1 uncharacterized protein LOC130986909 isoform X2 [Salvia miltiorrhiza]